MELLLLRLLVWVGLPVLLVVVAVGPGRAWGQVRRLWAWIEDRRHEPTEVLNRVVQEHQKNIKLVRDMLAQAESAQGETLRNVRRSEESITSLEREARTAVGGDDELGARAARYTLNLERLAI